MQAESEDGSEGTHAAAPHMQTLIHDTLTGSMHPASSGRPQVSIYLCGVTVYDDAHIGHARTIIVFDVLRRRLLQGGRRVTMIQNFTDVDDKIIERARAEGTTAAELSGRYIARYHEEFERLNVLRADEYPRATDHISKIIEFIGALIDGGAAYATASGVYFDVSKFGQYGKLSKRRTEELQSGARVDIDESKRDPLDFALWKFHNNRDDNAEPAWDSPWGAGRPGWHIECSAMSTQYLGPNIDIHGGGRDLIFPHHENEIAQSESLGRCGAGGLARIWMHVGMVTIGGEKMSKSLGNIRSVKRALEDWGPNIIRLFCLAGHYSKPVDYSDEGMRQSLTRWRQLEACCYELRHASVYGGARGASAKTGVRGEDGGGGGASAADRGKDGSSIISDCTSTFYAALDNDLNTHLALLALMDIISETNARIEGRTLDGAWASAASAAIAEMAGVLGLHITMPGEDEASDVDAAIDERARLRAKGRYQDADRIRDKLAAQGIEIFDRKDKTVWIKREYIKMDGD